MTSDTHNRREIRSFVKREGRLTPGQQRALDNHWPEFGIEDDTDLSNLDELFGRPAPKVIEIGFGNGSSLIEMAINQPECDFIGIEVHRPGVGQLLKAINDNQLRNVRVACTDAVALIKHRITDSSLSRVQIFFPDPWHKKRHNKRRIIQSEFVNVLADKIQSGGHLHLATDWEDYAVQMLADVSENTRFINTSSDNSYIERPKYRPLTKFEQRGHLLGHGVWDLLFKKK
ncbi:MAG TPA: tRNA (guanosine(46)-N7)-methyltransferase TrmB [Methylophaga aminisulfidivorans]|uniref:tRNA (guanine-N(7)-)-methyltransferase n=2 Tax=root TaxID=1 RepID=A0A7C1W1T9_9GAMM|nr:tRNA (guanosine(46)-N7)-methyltransferase TrmB [Methylophaga aminisulfidivorans]